MKKHTTRTLRTFKKHTFGRDLQMLTCYDYQSARLLNSTDLDLILVGDSLGNVVLGFETTVEVTLEHMIIFGSAVRKGAPEKFLVVDMPFGTYAQVDKGIENGIKLFQQTKTNAIKIEGCSEVHLTLIKRLTETGIPVMGHIGLTPQSVHEQGGYYIHGKSEKSASRLMEQAKLLESAGAFSIVLECVQKDEASKITQALSIPTIGIGSGHQTDGQVLVTNDLLGMGPDTPPSFCTPVTNLYQHKKDLIQTYLNQ